MLYLASDHGGFELKKQLLEFLQENGMEAKDMGPFTLDPQDDYPDYVSKVMEQMQKDPTSKAILLCKNGVGVNIMANKYKGIRAALSWEPKHASSTRNDDDTNVLTLPASY
ncbi:MAG: hypothetical protein ACD_22C00214G0001, partial [uncultured bacterium]